MINDGSHQAMYGGCTVRAATRLVSAHHGLSADIRLSGRVFARAEIRPESSILVGAHSIELRWSVYIIRRDETSAWSPLQAQAPELKTSRTTVHLFPYSNMTFRNAKISNLLRRTPYGNYGLPDILMCSNTSTRWNQTAQYSS